MHCSLPGAGLSSDLIRPMRASGLPPGVLPAAGVRIAVSKPSWPGISFHHASITRIASNASACSLACT